MKTGEWYSLDFLNGMGRGCEWYKEAIRCPSSGPFINTCNRGTDLNRELGHRGWHVHKWRHTIHVADLDCFNESRASDMNGNRGVVDTEWQRSKQPALWPDGHCTLSQVFLPSRSHHLFSHLISPCHWHSFQCTGTVFHVSEFPFEGWGLSETINKQSLCSLNYPQSVKGNRAKVYSSGTFIWIY